MIDERLSAFLDGECGANEAEAVCAALAAHPEQRAAWQRQLWLRAVLSETAAPACDPDFADRVMAALDASRVAPGERHQRVRPLLRTRRRIRRRRVGGLAAAAAVAAAAVLVVYPLQQAQSPTVAKAKSSQKFALAPAAATHASVGPDLHRVAAHRRAGDRWSVSNPAVADELNDYLIEHNGLARSYGMSSATPSFLRVAAYGQDEGR